MDKETKRNMLFQYHGEFSEGSLRRLKAIDLCRRDINSVFTQDDLDMIELKVLVSHNRGAGTRVPATLDIDSISAPVDKVTECLSPKWIQVRCVHGNTTFIRVRCRKCEGCRHAWRHRVRNVIMDGCSFERVYFWTLTIKESPGKMKGEDRFDVCQRRWHNLLRAAGKDGFKFEYLRVVELQKRGTPHLHIACRGFVYRGDALPTTEGVYEYLIRLARDAKFGFRKGKTIHFEAARLGGVGVASYMSKYLQKSENYYELVRKDGRAIRRYSRSRGWSKPSPQPAFRYARCDARLYAEWKSEIPVSCSCGEGMLLNYSLQVQKWLLASRIVGHWVAPLGLADHIFKKEKEEKCQLE